MVHPPHTLSCLRAGARPAGVLPLLLLAFGVGNGALGQDPQPPKAPLTTHHSQHPDVALPPEIRAAYRNVTSPGVRKRGLFRSRIFGREGSCVQASIAMLGAVHNVPAAESLLRESEHGPAVLGGSSSADVRKYCKERGIEARVVEGDRVWPEVSEALRGGRWAAVVYPGWWHMLCAAGIRGTGPGEEVAIVDNNSPETVKWVPVGEFRRKLGSFAVILDAPPPPGRPDGTQNTERGTRNAER